MITKVPNPNATPIVGQPITVLRWFLPVTVEFMCNCPVPSEVIREPLRVVASQSATCPHCQTVFTAAFDPNTNNMAFGISKPAPEPPKN